MKVSLKNREGQIEEFDLPFKDGAVPVSVLCDQLKLKRQEQNASIRASFSYQLVAFGRGGATLALDKEQVLQWLQFLLTRRLGDERRDRVNQLIRILPLLMAPQPALEGQLILAGEPDPQPLAAPIPPRIINLDNKPLGLQEQVEMFVIQNMLRTGMTDTQDLQQYVAGTTHQMANLHQLNLFQWVPPVKKGRMFRKEATMHPRLQGTQVYLKAVRGRYDFGQVKNLMGQGYQHLVLIGGTQDKYGFAETIPVLPDGTGNRSIIANNKVTFEWKD